MLSKNLPCKISAMECGRSSIFSKGFTIVEMLLVLIIVGMLATASLASFLDFRRDASITAVQNFLNNVKSAIAAKKTQMALRCGRPFSEWPRLQAILTNDITEGGATNASCTQAQIPEAQERRL